MRRHAGMAVTATAILVGLLAVGSPANAGMIGVKDVETAADVTLSDYTVSAGTDQVLLVLASGDGGSDCSVTAVTYGGSGLSQAGGAAAQVSKRAQRTGTDIWYLLDPTTGTAQDIQVTWADAGSSAITALVLSNVKQQAPEATNADAATDSSGASTSITTVTDGALVVDVVAVGAHTSWSPGAGITEQTDFQAGVGGNAHTQAAGTREVATAGSVTNNWTAGNSGTRAHSLAAFAPIPEPATLAVLALGSCGLALRRRRGA